MVLMIVVSIAALLKLVAKQLLDLNEKESRIRFQSIPNSSEIGNIEIANSQSSQADGKFKGIYLLS